MHDGTHYTELAFLHLVRYTCHVVHYVAPGAQKVDALFFILGWYWYGFHKNASGYLTPNLCFRIQWYLRVT
jgi:hypothetical protein